MLRKMSSVNAHGLAQMASAFVDIFRAITQKGDEFLNHIARVTDGET
jgi:hypothetical protein